MGKVIPGRFFKVSASERSSGLARLQADTSETFKELRFTLEIGGWFGDWRQLEFRLEHGVFADYLADVAGFRLCSDKLREMLDAVRGALDVFQWLPVWVEGDGDRRRYWVLHFPDPPDLLDQARTEILGLAIGRMTLDARKADGHEVMPSPDGRRYSFVVTGRVRAALRRAGCTGLVYRQVPTS